jgi:hypothetical protein
MLLLAAAAAVALPAGMYGQDQNASEPSAAQAPANAAYVPVNPLAGVRYDNRFDLSLGAAYDHMKAGPTLLQGSNLGGLDLSGSVWLTKHWGVEGTDRTYVGTSGAGTNSAGAGTSYGGPGGPLKGPFVSEYFFTAGPEWLGPHNQHGALIAHAMFGGVYGDFQKDLLGESPQLFDFYPNQLAPAAIIGGHFDLNRSPRWVFRVSPDAVFTWYSINYPPYKTATDVNFAISVGLEYKFKRKR